MKEYNQYLRRKGLLAYATDSAQGLDTVRKPKTMLDVQALPRKPAPAPQKNHAPKQPVQVIVTEEDKL
jgi:hypothetical protein